jgi:hypothetical protein
MTAAVLTWSAQYFGSGSADGTIAGNFDSIYSALNAADANADFPWEICSSELAHASTRYITLKPKGGGAGRILILFAVTSTDGQWNTNMQLSTAVPSSAICICYRGGATSDTPANLRGSSSAIFTAEVNADSTPVTSNINMTTTTGDKWGVAANADMVALFHTPSTGNWDPNSRRALMAGKILVDPVLDVEKAGALHSNAAAWIPVATGGINPLSTMGLFTFEGTTLQHWGKLGDYDASFMTAKARDLTNKKIYFPRLQLGSYQAATGGLPAVKYQLRQVAYLLPALAAQENITDGVDVFATSVGNSAASTWWLTNVKLY